MSFSFTADESPREQAILRVRQRFAALTDLIDGGKRDAASTGRFLEECFGTCQMIGRPGSYYLLVLAVRSRENPRESILAEIYFEGTDAIVFPAALLREQAESAAMLIEDFDAWSVRIPSPEELVKAFTGGTELEEVLKELGPFEQWTIRSIRRLVAKPPTPEDSEDAVTRTPRSKEWIQLYQSGNKVGAVDTISEHLRKEQSRTEQARLYNDRGYIRYDIKEQLEAAKRDLQTAVDLHHRGLSLTLLNLAVAAIDDANFPVAMHYLNDVLLITLGRESLSASFVRLRLLAGHLPMVKREKWEEHPANVIEGAYINMGYATAHAAGYEAAQEVLEEGRELMPSSARVTHALARLHLWRRRADRADPLYRQLSEIPLESELRREVEMYMNFGGPRRRKV